MAIDTVSQFIDALRQSRLLDAGQQDEIDRQLQTRFADPRTLARELIQRGWLTPYQVNQLMQGNGHELILGPFRILERIGAGGMGQVFKARHGTLDKIVALKVIRKEHLGKPDAVHRFLREIRAVSKLSHPNIVMAIDAEAAGDTAFLAMEFVEGIDLLKLVKESGPLPVPQALEYLRQAALGLQHASEQGLVHRDIKPANLLIGRPPSAAGIASPALGTAAFASGGGVLKLLDMGLAKVIGPSDSNDLSWRTQDGKVLGTPDYMAPEQALKSSEADVRADLYSLGCTFYFALTGKVPYPGGTLMEKLLKHKMDPAPSVETLRPEVPKAVGDVFRKLMAKKPADRYQTPAELLAALGVLTGAPPMPNRAASTRPTAVTSSEATAEESRTRLPSSDEMGAAVGKPVPALVLTGVLLVIATVLYLLFH